MRIAVMSLSAVLMIAGCGGPSWYHSAGSASPTGDLGLQLKLEDSKTVLFAQYRVAPDGTITFWGGKDLVFDNVTWEGTLTEEQGQELVALVRTEHLMQSPPGSAAGDDERTWTLELIDAEAKRQYTVYGKVESLEKLYAFLQQASSSRFSTVLDEFPQPSIDQIVVPEQPPADEEDASEDEET